VGGYEEKFLRPNPANFSGKLTIPCQRAVKNFRNTTCCGMTTVSLPVYSESPPQKRGRELGENRISTPDLAGGIMEFDSNDTVGGYAVPVDPMDLLQCDSCQ